MRLIRIKRPVLINDVTAGSQLQLNQPNPVPNRSLLTACISAFATAVLCLPTAEGGDRRFAYTYETLTSPKGSWELENTITYKRSPLHDRDLDSFSFRHEIEYGVTDRFQLAVYVANWDFAPRGGEDEEEEEAEHGGGEASAEAEVSEKEEKHEKSSKPHRSARYGSSGVEMIYNLTNPNTDWIGSALYVEGNIGDRFAELETKLLLQKNFGKLTVAYNAILEFEWEGAHLDGEEIEFGQTVGVSYEVTPQFSVGGELLHQIDMPDFNRKNAERAQVYVGPNVTFRSKGFFATASALWRTTDNAGEPDMQARVIVGVDF